MSAPDETYLGDGLYASFDGYMVALRAPREEGDHFVYLEPATLRALLQYAPVEAAVAREARPATSGCEGEADRARFEWFFGPADKLAFMNVYMEGMRKGWTAEQWRTAIDAQRLGREKESK